MTATVFNLGQWPDFFFMVGGGAAALTGLAFVAMTLNLASITQDAIHRHRAIGTAGGFRCDLRGLRSGLGSADPWQWFGCGRKSRTTLGQQVRSGATDSADFVAVARRQRTRLSRL